MRTALITGAAGFIGSHLVDVLMAEGWCVTALDNFDPFYDPAVKRGNIGRHVGNANFTFVEADIRDLMGLKGRIDGAADVLVHLAAKAGVRPSIQDPVGYQQTNVQGTQNLLEFARERGIPQFIFASSSSVYGINPRVPWSEDDHVLLPISPYASTKVSGELMGHVYAHLFGIRFLALRFFTVYGPRQRPDLAIHKFARLMQQGKALPLYGDGGTRRDYTYCADIVAGIRAAIDYGETAYEVINLGNHHTVSLHELVRTLTDVTGIDPTIEWLPEQPGDVSQTFADIAKAKRLLGYEPKTDLRAGIENFWSWLNRS